MSSYRITQSPVPFQSTPSAWRETAFTALVSSYRGISIHSLRMEGDAADRPKRSAVKVFQSTPSAWRETYCLQWWQFRKTHHFNPLPPHGGRRRQHLDIPDAEDTFQSTPSAWRETGAEFSRIPHNAFQSTPSAWRETRKFRNLLSPVAFQSTPSAWRETAKLHRKAFFISPILVQSCKKGCKRLHSAPEKMVFFEKREKNLVRNLQHLSVRL